MLSDSSPLEWTVNHFRYIGWPSALYACFKIIQFCIGAGRGVAMVEGRVLDGERTLHLLATNHLPHLEMAIKETSAKQDETNKLLELMGETLKGIREDMRDRHKRA